MRGGRVELRDSNRPSQIAWFYDRDWKAFTDGVRNGEFDVPSGPETVAVARAAATSDAAEHPSTPDRPASNGPGSRVSTPKTITP